MTTPNKDQLLEKVRSMLALAESERELGHEEAAEAHTATAMRWMAKYGIDKAMAEARGHANHLPTQKVFTCTAPYAGSKAHLIHSIARALHCQGITLYTRRGSNFERVQVYGYQSDIEMVDMLYTSLLLQMSSATVRHKVASWITGRALMAERRSFMYGFTAEVEERLTEAYALAVDETDDSGTTGKELVLASREVAIKALYRQEHPNVRRTRSTYSGGSSAAGRAAGARANIHNRPEAGAGSTRALSR